MSKDREANREGFTKTVNWGQALHLEAIYSDGGLAGAVDRIHAAVGKSYGTRNTFKTLFSAGDVPESEIQQQRAVLLLLALGQNPSDWGLSGVQMPPAFDQKVLSDLGINASGWFSGTELAAA
jgi:hypothetical protein